MAQAILRTSAFPRGICIPLKVIGTAPAAHLGIASASGPVVTGLIMAAFSGKVVKGSSFWVSYWEHKLEEIEVKVLPHVEIFRNHPRSGNTQLLKSLRKRWNLRYVSTRKSTIWMFRVLLILWLLLLSYIIVLYASIA